MVKIKKRPRLGEDTVLGDHTYRYLTADEMKSLGDDSLPIDVTRDERIDSNRIVTSADSMLPPQHIEDTISPEHISKNYVEYIKKYTPDNVDIARHPISHGFLVSFLVDARGGAMRGCRHSGVKVIVPPRCAPSPTRITCRYVRPQRTPHPPPLMEGEALASRVLELGPVGAKFLGPVIIEVPHFAALRGKEREIVILRSDNGDSWKEHTVEATEEVLNDVLHDSFEAEDLNQLEDISSGRITRIVTQDFPQYFAVVSRVRQEVHAIGPEGGMVSSTVVPQVQAIFPEGALTKKIKVGLQAQPIDPELTAKLLGHGVAVSPVVTVEPRRRKFHKAIRLNMPAPTAHSQGMINQYSGSAPTLRLLCSITGGTTRAQWEDVTGSTPLTFVNDVVSFTTTVSARFWLMDCRNIGDATKMATELYKEVIHVPFMAKFVVFAKRVDPLEARLRVFCMTDDKEDKTLEHQEHFTEVAKSRDVEVLEGKPQYIEFSGNLVPITKSGEQLQFSFRAFRENRLPFSVRVKDQHAEAVGRCLFMKEAKVQKGEPPQQPICILNIVLPDDIVTDTISLTDSDSIKRHMFLSESYDYYRPDPRLADMSNLLGDDWVELAHQLGLTSSEVNVIKSEYPESTAKQAQSMLRMWLSQSGNKAQTNTLENALKRIGREDIIPQCLNVEQPSHTITRIKQEEIGYRLSAKDDKREKKEEPRIIDKNRIDGFDKYSAEEKFVEKSESEEEDFDKTVPELRQEIEKRLSAERAIPASSQRREIVQEITSIKEQTLVEEKLAEVQQKEPEVKIVTTTTRISPDKTLVSESIEQKTTIPSKPKDSEVTVTETTTTHKVLSPTQVDSDKQEKITHKIITTTTTTTTSTDQHDTELLEGVTQRFEVAKRIGPKIVTEDDMKSPKFSKTPPPSPADFLVKEKQATTAQEWDASGKPAVSKPATVGLSAAQQGISTTTTQYLASNEDKPLDQNRVVANLKPIIDQTNALIQYESRAEPYHTHTEKHYQLKKAEDSSLSDSTKEEKKPKRGFFGTLKTLVGKSSTDHSDSDSEKAPKKDKVKKQKKKKKKNDVTEEAPIPPPRKPKYPSPKIEHKEYADIPYFEAAPDEEERHSKPPVPPRTDKLKSKKETTHPELPDKIIEIKVSPVPTRSQTYEIEHQAKAFVDGIVIDSENVVKTGAQKSPKDEKKKRKTVVIEEQITKTFAPAAIEEEEFTVVIDPTRKESPKKSRETFTLNIDESIDEIEKEILEKSPILSEEKIVKPFAHLNDDIPPERPPRIKLAAHYYEDIDDPSTNLSHSPNRLLIIQDWYEPHSVAVKKATTDLIENESSFPAWAEDPHNVCNKQHDEPNDEIKGKVTDNQKIKRKPKLFGLFGKTPKDIGESEDESSKTEIIEKQDNEDSKEKTTQITKEADEHKKGFRTIFGKKTKLTKSDSVTPQLSEKVLMDMINTSEFLKQEVNRYEDSSRQLKKDEVATDLQKLPLIKKAKSKEKDDKSFLGGIFKKSKKEEATTQEPLISDKVIKDMNDTAEFLNEEVKKYHDVRPVTLVDQKATPEKIIVLSSTKPKDIFDSKEQQKREVKTSDVGFITTKIVDISTLLPQKDDKEKPIILSEATLLDMQHSSAFLKGEVDNYHDVYPVSTVLVETSSEDVAEEIRKRSKGLLGFLKKTSEEHVVIKKQVEESVSEEHKEKMRLSDIFLKDEVDHYYDVRPMVRIPVAEVVEEITHDRQNIEAHKESKGILGIFKKKKHDRKSLEKEIESISIKPVLTEEVVKTMNDTNKFLIEEVKNYYDIDPVTHVVKPAEQTIESLEVTTQTETTKWYDGSLKKDEKDKELKPKKESKGILGILKKKHDKPTELKEIPKFSDVAIRNMKDADMFLKNEVVWHHDVYPICIKIEETHVEEKKQVSREPSKDRDIEKRESKKIFGIFQKKSEHAAEEPKTVILSNTVINKMKQTDNFVKTEVDKYHDVRPVISEQKKALVMADQESALQGGPLNPLDTVVEDTKPTGHIPKDEVDKHYDVEPVIQKSAYKDSKYDNTKKESRKKETKTLFDIFKIRGKSESKDDEPRQQDESSSIVLPKQGLLNMQNSHNFLKDEVDNYHDVKPIIADNRRSLSPDIGKTKKMETDHEKIKVPSEVTLSEEIIQDIQNSDNFLKQEVVKYHDVKPRIIKDEILLAEPEIKKDHEKVESKKIIGIFKIKKDDSKAISPIKIEISEEAKRDMLNTNDFLELEVNKYHDVRPIVLKEIPKSPDDKKETSAVKVEDKKESKKIFGLFKKKSSSDDTKNIEVEVKTSKTKISVENAELIQDTDVFLKEEVDKYHDVHPFLENESIREETLVSEIPQIGKPVTGGSIFKIFKKESSPKKATPKLKLSQEAIQTLQNCNDFLQKEVQKYHDVRPTINESPIDAEKIPVPKLEDKKQAKKLFGLFKLKSSSDDTTNTISEASQKQVKASEESLKAIQDSDIFLKQEVDKYHDVWPGVESKTIEERVPVSEAQQTDKTITSGGIFKIFKREGSPKKTTDKPKLSEQVIKNFNNCNDFLEQEIKKYYDVRPIMTKEVPIPRQGKADESEKIMDKKESKKLFGLFKKVSSDDKKDSKVEDKTTKAKFSQETVKLMQDSDSFLKQEIDNFHDVYSFKIKKILEKKIVVDEVPKTEKTVILEPKYQKEAVQVKDTTSPPSESHKQAVARVSSIENQKPVISKSVQNDMQSSNTFLTQEVQKYHDVRPIYKIKSETTIGTEDTIVSKGLFSGLYNTKPQELSQKNQQKSDHVEKEKTIHETTNFLNTELMKYEDSKVEQKPIIEKPKKELKVETQKAPPISKEVIKDMIDTSNFIREEIVKYHDVRPTIKPLELTEKQTKSGKLFGFFGKKKSRDRSVERNVVDEKQDKKKIKEEIIKPKNIIISGTVMQNMEDSKKFLHGELEHYEDASRTAIKIPQDVKKEDIVTEKHGGFFGLFSKKTKPDKEMCKHDEENEQELKHHQKFVESLNNTNAFIKTEVEKYHDVRPVSEKPLILPSSTEGAIIKAKRVITEKVEEVLKENRSKIGKDIVEIGENDEDELRKKKKTTTVIEEYTPHGEKTIRITKEMFAINPETMENVADLDEDIKVKIMEARKVANDPDRDTSKPFSRETFIIETKIIDRLIPVSPEKETVIEKQETIKTTTVPDSQKEKLLNIQPYAQDFVISPDTNQTVKENTKDFLLNELLSYEDVNSQVRNFSDATNINEDFVHAPEVDISKTKRSTAFGIFGKNKSQRHEIVEEQKQKSPKAKPREKIFGKPKSQNQEFSPEPKEEIVVVSDVKDDKEKRDRKKRGSPFKFLEKQPKSEGKQTVGKTEIEDNATTAAIISPKSPEKSQKHKQHEKRKSGGFLSFFTKESSKDEPQTKEDDSKLTKSLTTEVKQLVDTDKVEQQLSEDVKIFESEDFHKDDLQPEDKTFVIREKNPQVEENITVSNHRELLNSDVLKEISDLDRDILDRIEKLKEDSSIEKDDLNQYVSQTEVKATMNDTMDFLNNEQRNYEDAKQESKVDLMEKVGMGELGVKEKKSGLFGIFGKGKSQERELIQDEKIPPSEPAKSQENEAPISPKSAKRPEKQKKREKRKSGGFLSFFAKDSTEEERESDVDSQHIKNVCDTNKFLTMEVNNYTDAKRVIEQPSLENETPNVQDLQKDDKNSKENIVTKKMTLDGDVTIVAKQTVSIDPNVTHDITKSNKGTLENIENVHEEARSQENEQLEIPLDIEKEVVKETKIKGEKSSDVAKPSTPRDIGKKLMEHSQNFLQAELVHYEDAKPTSIGVQEHISEENVEKESKSGLFSIFTKSKSQEKEILSEKVKQEKESKGILKPQETDILSPESDFDRKEKKGHKKHGGPFKIFDRKHNSEDRQELGKSKSQDKGTVIEIKSPKSPEKTEKRNKREKRKSGGFLSFFTKESAEEMIPEVNPQHVHILNDTTEFLTMEVKNYEDVVRTEKKLSTEEPICQDSLEDELLKERKITTVTKEITPHGEKTITVTKQMISIDPNVMKKVDDLDKDIIDKIERAREEANSLSRDTSEPFVREHMTIETKIINREIPIVSEKETTTETITTISPTIDGDIKTTTRGSDFEKITMQQTQQFLNNELLNYEDSKKEHKAEIELQISKEINEKQNKSEIFGIFGKSKCQEEEPKEKGKPKSLEKESPLELDTDDKVKKDYKKHSRPFKIFDRKHTSEAETKQEKIEKRVRGVRELTEPEDENLEKQKKREKKKSAGFPFIFTKVSATEEGKVQIDPKHIKNLYDTIEFLTTEVKNYDDAVRVEKTAPGIKISLEGKIKESIDAKLVKSQGEKTTTATKQIFSIDSDVIKYVAGLDHDTTDKIIESAGQDTKSMHGDISEIFPKEHKMTIETQVIDKQIPVISEKDTVIETKTLVQNLPGIEKETDVTISSDSDIFSRKHTKEFLINELINYEDAKIEIQKPVPGEESEKKEIKHGLFGIFGRGKSPEITEETKVKPARGLKKKVFGKPNLQEKEMPSELESDDNLKKHSSPFKTFDRKNKSGDEPELEKKEKHTETQEGAAEKQKKRREKRRSGGFLSLFSKDSESLEEEQKVTGPQHYQPDVIKVLQDTTNFLNTEIVNYEDAKPQIVTDLDEDSDVPKSGLFSLFSKKDKESPRAMKKMFKKQKKDRSVDKDEGKVGIIEKITRKFTDLEDEVADIRDVPEGTFKKFGDAVDEGIEGVQKTMLSTEMHDETKPKTVTFTIPTAAVLEQSSDDIAQDVGATVKSAKVKIVDTKNAGIQKLNETPKNAGEGFDKIDVSKRDLVEASDGTLKHFKDTALEGESKVEGFLNKFGRRSYSPKPEGVRIEKEPVTENVVEGIHHEDHKKDEGRKEKKVGFFGKIIGGKQKTKDVHTEIDYIKQSSTETVDDIITKAETEADRVKRSEQRTSGIDFSTEFPKSDSNFVDEILQSFDEKMGHVKEDREEELFPQKQEIGQQVQRETLKSTGVSTRDKLKDAIVNINKDSQSFLQKIDEQYSETMKLSKELAEETKHRANKGFDVSFDFLDNEKAHATKQLKAEKCAVESELGKYHHKVRHDIHQLAQDTADITIEKKQDILNKVKELQSAADRTLITSQESVQDTVAKLAFETERLKAELESTQRKLDKTGEDIKETIECTQSTTKDVTKKSGGFLSKLGKKLSGKTDRLAHDSEHGVKDLTDVTKKKTKEGTHSAKIESSGLETGISTKEKDIQSTLDDTKDKINIRASSTKDSVKRSTLELSENVKEITNEAKESITHKAWDKEETIQSDVKEIITEPVREVQDDICEQATHLKKEKLLAAKKDKCSLKETIKETSEHLTKADSDAKTTVLANSKQFEDALETTKQISDSITATNIETKGLSEGAKSLKETTQILKGQLDKEADSVSTSVKKHTQEISNRMTEVTSGTKAEITEKLKDIKETIEKITDETDRKAQQKLEKTAKKFSENTIEASNEASQKLRERTTDIKKSTEDVIDDIDNTGIENRICGAVLKTAEETDRVIHKTVDNDNLQQKTSDFIESEVFSDQQDFYQIPRTVSDYGSSMRETGASAVPNISEANLDLSNLPKNVDSRGNKYGTSAYITSPTAARRAASQRFLKGERPEVIEVRYTYSDDVSSDDSYIVTEPDEVTEKKSKKPLFHIESEDDDSLLDTSKQKLTERSESVRSNILETLTEHEVDDLLSNLTKDLDEATKSTKEVCSAESVVQKEEERLEEHKKAEVDLIERKLRDLDIALGFLEQDDHKIITELTDDPKREKKLKRVERKFERMASEALDKELAEAKHKEIPTPDVEEKRENDFQSLVSQLSVEEVSDFQKEYSHIWDENTFSKSDGLDSKTPDSQADAQELPKGDDKPTDSQKPTSSISQVETEESQDSQKAEKSKGVADQHQLSGEMKELLKELEKESKQ